MKTIKDKYSGMSFAEAAKKIEKKYKERKFDSLQDKAYQEEMKILMRMHEDAKAKEAAKKATEAQFNVMGPEKAAEITQAITPTIQEEGLSMMKEGGYFPNRYKKMGFSGVNKPKRTPGASKSHAVVVKDGDSYKLIRFGQQGVSGAGKNPKTDKEKARRKSFKARHAKNIAKGKTSAAYWANKVKWAEGGWIQQAAEKMKEKGTEGAFTRSAKQAGMGVQAYATKVLNDPDASTTQKRRANFAKNMAAINKKKMVNGGNMFPTTSTMPNVVDYINDASIENEMANDVILSPLDRYTNVQPIQSSMDYMMKNQNDLLKKQTSDEMSDYGQKGIVYSKGYRKAKKKAENAQRLAALQANQSAYDPALRSARFNRLMNLGILSGGPERRSPVFNPYEGDIRNKVDAMNANLDPIRQSVQSNANAAINRIANMSRSASNAKSNIANIYANMNTSLANADMQQQQQMNNIRNMQANIMNTLGAQKQQAITIAKEINDRNRASFINEMSKFGAAVMDQGKFTTRLEVQKGQNALMARIISDSSEDFNLSNDTITKISEGRYNDLSKSELIELEKALPENVFKTFGETYKSSTGKELTTEKKNQVKSSNQGDNMPPKTSTTYSPRQEAIKKAESVVVPGTSTGTINGSPIDTSQPSNASTSNQGYTYTPNQLTSTVQGVSDHAYSRLADIMDFEKTKGSASGTGLSNFGNPQLGTNPTKEDATKWIAENIYLKTAGQGTDDERISITDHWYNSGVDARIYAYQEWLKKTDPNNTTGWQDSSGNWKDRMKYRNANKGRVGNQDIYGWTDQQLKQEFEQLYQKVPAADRRDLLKAGRHTHLSGLIRNDNAYENTWRDRVEYVSGD